MFHVSRIVFPFLSVPHCIGNMPSVDFYYFSEEFMTEKSTYILSVHFNSLAHDQL